MAISTERFSNRVADYVAARPGYPAAVVDELRKHVRLTEATRVADVGAGTGISARMLLDAGCHVVAVEPNDAMREAIGTDPRLRAVKGTAEHTTLPDASVDLVVVAQAFHWFDRDAFRRECRRILAPRGHVAILFNDRLPTGTPFLDGYERLLLDHGVDYVVVNHRNVGESGVAAFFAPHPVARIVMRNAQRFDLAGLERRVFSSSYAPPPDDPRAVPMRDAIARLFAATDVDGAVEMVYETQLSIGRVE